MSTTVPAAIVNSGSDEALELDSVLFGLRGLGAAVQAIGVAYEHGGSDGLVHLEDALQGLGEQIVALAKKAEELVDAKRDSLGIIRRSCA